MIEVAAVAVGHRRQNPTAIFAGVERDLGNFRKLFSDLVLVVRDGRAEAVLPHLLVKIDVLLGALAFVRVTRVEDGRAIGQPGGAAAAGRVLNARDFVGQHFPGVGLDKVKRALFAAALGKRECEQASVWRCQEPVNRRGAIGVKYVGIEDHAPKRWWEQR